MKNPFTTGQWLAIFGGAWASITYVYANFPTLREFSYLQTRLESIERKIDRALSVIERKAQDADHSN